ncbi:MAG TPA: DUF5565 family protein [Candidatus Saccharimonadia bacterium]|nr:DUF5565 family protein [Candidatus Saccharimonadia bacterium]
MKKIPTIFVRDMTKQPALVTPIWSESCVWVRDGEGIATRKYDGTSCMVRDGKLYKRRELKAGDKAPVDFESLGTDENTGKTVGWVPVGEGPDDRWHREAMEGYQPDGTYELLGPKVQGNKDQRTQHVLQDHHMARTYPLAPRDYDGIKAFLTENLIEGIVWHHDDGRMAKIKRRDFGLKW